MITTREFIANGKTISQTAIEKHGILAYRIFDAAEKSYTDAKGKELPFALAALAPEISGHYDAEAVLGNGYVVLAAYETKEKAKRAFSILVQHVKVVSSEELADYEKAKETVDDAVSSAKGVAKDIGSRIAAAFKAGTLSHEEREKFVNPCAEKASEDASSEEQTLEEPEDTSSEETD